MIVKKIQADWQPSENPFLKVGDTIEITDPKQLILDGVVAAIDDNGQEVSAYDLYGVLVQNEVKEFEDYLKMKKQESLKKQLDTERQQLEDQLRAQERANQDAAKAAEPKVETQPVQPVVQPAPAPVTAEQPKEAKKK